MPGRRAFTLIELLVVMGIILVLASIAIPVANSARQKAKDTEVKAGCSNIQKALELYATDHAGQYPGAHWERDSTGAYYVGPGVLGGTPTYFGTEVNQDFYTPKDSADPRMPFLADGTPNPQSLDSLVVGGYLEDYPSNPFLRASDGKKAQMSNLFLFNPILGTSAPDPALPDTLDWNRYTGVGESMRTEYLDVGRGHFSYIPLNPTNTTGFDYVGEWNTGNLSDAQLSEYYKGCKGYILVGWGHERMDDSQAKGVSTRFWDNGLGGFDFDKNLSLDSLEQVLSNTGGGGLLSIEQQDSTGAVGAFGGPLPGGAVDIDQAFYGATFFTVSGS
ncbi:type II secretion system protein [bacterium]|nr:type II secretion system protein [bacterium]